MRDVSKVKVKADWTGKGRIVIDDKDISGVVTAVNIKIRSGCVTKVFVELTPDVDLYVEGEVIGHARRP
jgi:hypothetical protein